MRDFRMYALLTLGVSILGGCNLLTPLIFVGEHKRQVAPEFDKLRGSRTAVVVWTDQSTLFDFPFARFELATYISDKIYTETSQRSMGTELVDPRDVDNYIQRNSETIVDPVTIGREFDADYVVYVEVLEFQTRDSQQPQLLRGRIGAAVSVFDIRSEFSDAEPYELEPVHCIYPDNAPVLMTATNTRLVREATYLKFSELVARKFYEYTEDL